MDEINYERSDCVIQYRERELEIEKERARDRERERERVFWMLS